MATALAALAALRAWEVFDAKVDLLLAVCLAFVAAIVAGAVDLGTDTLSYRQYYLGQLAAGGPQFNWWEPGFSTLAWLFAMLGAPYGAFVFACVLVSHLIKLHVFNRLLFNRLLAFFIVFCLSVGELGFVRQYLAASLILLAYYLLYRGKTGSAMLSILLAVMFHKTALMAGVVVMLVFYGVRSFTPLLIFAMSSAAILLIVPGSLKQEIVTRVEFQVASYAVQEFVQGLGSDRISLFRNVAKFAAYLAFSFWMVLLPATPKAERAQRRSAGVVIVMSLMSVALVAVVSPVFARMSTFVFPFLALCVRGERFRPYASQFAGQYAASLLLILNLAVSIYSLAGYF
ncbi:MAG TPA: EpsG family protein [Steroidobacteraceae bacterium]|nr:EpsG family protein [Steroidobacteraceae bacterium]